MKLNKISSLGELDFLARQNKAYADLAISAAKNLGGMNITNARQAMDWLWTNAEETDEDGVVAEVNFCI